jgi:hypothetical protein
MAKNWTAYEAAKEIIEGKNKENICEIGSRYPMLTREVAVAGDKILVILKALPKVTARVLETGLKDGVEVETEAEEETKEVETEVEDDELDYTDMTSANLYKLCCARGISSKCKSRKKDALIELLEKFDRGELDEEEPKKEAKKASKGKAKKAEPVVEEDEDDWDTEDEEEKDPYEGKTAMELFKMCKERGIKTKPKQKADAYVKLLKAADAESEAEEAEDDEDDDWEI